LLKINPIKTPEKENDESVFQDRGDGLGWTLNFNNKWSYVVLIAMLIVVGSVIWWINHY